MKSAGATLIVPSLRVGMQPVTLRVILFKWRSAPGAAFSQGPREQSWALKMTPKPVGAGLLAMRPVSRCRGE